jgi:hypothetical protein
MSGLCPLKLLSARGQHRLKFSCIIFKLIEPTQINQPRTEAINRDLQYYQLNQLHYLVTVPKWIVAKDIIHPP